MLYTNHYESPLGKILLAGDDEGLTGLWFTEGTRYVGLGLKGKPFPMKQNTSSRRRNGSTPISQAVIPVFCPNPSVRVRIPKTRRGNYV